MASSVEKRMEAVVAVVAVAVAVGWTGSQSAAVGFLEYHDVPPVSFSFDI